MKVVKCQFDHCPKPSTWNLGTWDACDEHAKPFVVKSPHDLGGYFCPWGSAGRFGFSTNFATPISPDQQVEVTEQEYLASRKMETEVAK